MNDRKWALAMFVGMVLAAGLGFWSGAIIGHAIPIRPAGYCVVVECA